MPTNTRDKPIGPDLEVRGQGVVRYLAAISFCVLSLVPSMVDAEAKSTTTCNPVGRWAFKETRQVSGSTCEKRESSFDVNLIVVKKGSGYEVRENKDVDNAKLKVETSGQGGCHLTYQYEYNMTPCAPPWWGEFEYEFLQKDGVVSGISVYREFPIDNDAPNAKPNCTDVLIVTGTKKALTSSDVTIDKTKVPGEFASFYKEFIKKFCTLPILAQNKKEVSAVRVVVGTLGEIKRLWIDGVDQQVDKNCTKVVSDGCVPAFRNPTGTDQTLDFAVHLP